MDMSCRMHHSPHRWGLIVYSQPCKRCHPALCRTAFAPVQQTQNGTYCLRTNATRHLAAVTACRYITSRSQLECSGENCPDKGILSWISVAPWCWHPVPYSQTPTYDSFIKYSNNTRILLLQQNVALFPMEKSSSWIFFIETWGQIWELKKGLYLNTKQIPWRFLQVLAA